MTLLDNDAFLAELARLYEKTKATGGHKTLSITMKRYNGRTKPVPNPRRAHPKQPAGSATTAQNTPPTPSTTRDKEPKGPQEKLCLVRAKLGNTKISTVVHAKETNKFLLAYTQVMKSHTADALKKREK